MTNPADLSRLRINRDAPTAPSRTPLWRNLILFALSLIVVAVGIALLRARGVPTVKIVIASVSTGANATTGGATSITANGYVVARTKASLSARPQVGSRILRDDRRTATLERLF